MVVLNTIMGFVQEWRAERALAALRQMAAPRAMVLRDGQERLIAASLVVPGDILLLETGDRVAADARLLKSDDLEVDESALTGESQPVFKQPGRHPESQALIDRTNMVWTSTSVTAGRGRAVVVATGMDTVIGEIATEVRQTEREETPLQRRMGRLGTILGIGGILLASGLFGLGILQGYEIIEMVLFSVAVAVSAIPEGLPAVISVTLALGVQRMARRNAIIRRLPAVETLGSTTVICSDKTGTITKNEMTITRMWVGRRTYTVTGQGYEPEGEIYPEDGALPHELSDELRTLLTIGSLANNARLIHNEKGWWIEGDPTEGAILVVARKAGFNIDQLKRQQPRKAEIPFTSEQKYMATMHPAPDRSVVYVKGAPERVIDFCTHMLEDGKRVELDESRRQIIKEVNTSFARQALRVVAGAYRDLPADTEKLDRSLAQSELTFAGLWGMVDPPRPEAIKAINDARGAGIHVVMITGDHAVTASAIAEKVGISRGAGQAISGSQIEEMSKEELADQAMTVGVFARVSPAHKLKILEALKEKGHIVAMTGDGVNDAPALKGADIGVAMGKTGTEVAKEAADMILTDDNFATIVNAIEEGRVIFSNLYRVVAYLITTNIGEVFTLTAALMLGMPLPLTAIMILWVNLVTDGACTVPLGVEPKHWDVLKQPPRAPGSGILDRFLVRRLLLLSPVMAVGTLGLFAYELQIGSFQHAQTVAFTTLVSFEWFRALSARSSYLSLFSIGILSNRWLIAGISGAILLQLGAVYSGPGQVIFSTVPLSLTDWALIIPVASSILIFDEILKRLGVYGRLPVSVTKR